MTISEETIAAETDGTLTIEGTGGIAPISLPVHRMMAVECTATPTRGMASVSSSNTATAPVVKAPPGAMIAAAFGWIAVAVPISKYVDK
jgi:hypothetical protein